MTTQSRYLEGGILAHDPFQTLDQSGVGICGEHGGDPASIAFCHELGLDYVSCSPYRVPVARLVAAQAELAEAGAGEYVEAGG